MIHIFQKQRQISILTFSSHTEYVKTESIFYIVINSPSRMRRNSRNAYLKYLDKNAQNKKFPNIKVRIFPLLSSSIS